MAGAVTMATVYRAKAEARWAGGKGIDQDGLLNRREASTADALQDARHEA